MARPFVTTVAAQTAGTITGTLSDANGGVLPGVSVTVRDTATGLSRTVVTGAAGRFVVAAIPPGLYDLRAELAGFKPHVRQAVTVAVATTVNLNITLQIGALEIEDVVVGTMPLVNTSSPELSYLVGATRSRAAAERPQLHRPRADAAGRHCISSPRRRIGGRARSRHEHQRAGSAFKRLSSRRHAAERLHQRPRGSAAGTVLGMETIREFRVETNSYSAEFGRNSGGQINVLTKSGTNVLGAAPMSTTATTTSTRRNFFDPERSPSSSAISSARR